MNFILGVSVYSKRSVSKPAPQLNTTVATPVRFEHTRGNPNGLAILPKSVETTIVTISWNLSLSLLLLVPKDLGYHGHDFAEHNPMAGALTIYNSQVGEEWMRIQCHAGRHKSRNPWLHEYHSWC